VAVAKRLRLPPGVAHPKRKLMQARHKRRTPYPIKELARSPGGYQQVCHQKLWTTSLRKKHAFSMSFASFPFSFKDLMRMSRSC
jgi:hypothetical protein